MVVHRLTKKKYAHDSLGGAGGLMVGGRWHHKGVRIVYCAQSLSLASLEFFVHFELLSKAVALVAVEIELPDTLVEDLPVASLPSDWDAMPPISGTADIGTDWVMGGRSVALRVPSVLTAGEYNVLINPAHRDSKRIRVRRSVDCVYDRRISERRPA